MLHSKHRASFASRTWAKGLELCGFRMKKIPEGSKDPNKRDLGPRYYNTTGTWTLRD